jgi:hypothetical protein
MLGFCRTAAFTAPAVVAFLGRHFRKDRGSRDRSGGIVIADNGSGLPTETIEGVLDYTVRMSSREAYVSPTRGAPGNALKCVVAMRLSAAARRAPRIGAGLAKGWFRAYRTLDDQPAYPGSFRRSSSPMSSGVPSRRQIR